MSSLNALKKLKKKAKKAKSQSEMQLQRLKNKRAVNQDNYASKDSLRADIKSLSGQVTMDVVSELAAPLNPLLSWFGADSRSLQKSAFSSTPVIQSVSNRPLEAQSKRDSLAMVPLKSPPCKTCPALKGKLCKCAVKRFA